MIPIRRNTLGFTLIEMLVTIAVLGIVMSALASIYSTMADGMMNTTARASALEGLTLAANQVASDLRNIRYNASTADTNPFHLVGVNPDGTFENSKNTAHNNLGTDPNDHSDRLHIIVNLRDSQLRPGNMASERSYYAYWINGEASPKAKPAFCLEGYDSLAKRCTGRGRYGLLKRRSTHARNDVRTSGSLIPLIENYESGDSVPAPLEDLNQDDTNYRGTEILGMNIDYFSIRYYDSQNSTWQTCWDTTDSSACGHSGDNNGEFPTVIQFALRAYDRRANQASFPEDDLMEPVWYQTAVTIRKKK